MGPWSSLLLAATITGQEPMLKSGSMVGVPGSEVSEGGWVGAALWLGEGMGHGARARGVVVCGP